MSDAHLSATNFVDFDSAPIQALVAHRNHDTLAPWAAMARIVHSPAQ